MSSHSLNQWWPSSVPWVCKLGSFKMFPNCWPYCSDLNKLRLSWWPGASLHHSCFPYEISIQLCHTIMYHHDDVIKWKHFPCYWPFVRGVTGEFPAQRPVTRSLDVFFYLRLNKQFSKQSLGWWFEMPSRSLCRHCNVFLRKRFSLMTLEWL